MLEQGVNERRPSNDRKRRSDGHDFEAKRRSMDASGMNTSFKSSYGGVHIPSYPVSSIYHSQRDAEIGNGTSSSHSRPSPVNSMGPAVSTKEDMMKRYDSSLIEEGYPGQYDLREYPYGQQDGNVSRRDYELETPPMPSYSLSGPQTRRSRFNLSRYQLDEDEDLPASAILARDPEEKPNRFKTQRERVMLAERAEQNEEVSGSTAPSFDEISLYREDADSSSQSEDSCVSQRERLRRFSHEQARHVVVPNEWEGETRLQQFVAFGDIESALRPLGLMMARAALVSDSVTTRHQRRSVSSGPALCSHSNPLTYS